MQFVRRKTMTENWVMMVRQKLENGAMHGVRKIKDMKKCRKLEKSKKNLNARKMPKFGWH